MSPRVAATIVNTVLRNAKTAMLATLALGACAGNPGPRDGTQVLTTGGVGPQAALSAKGVRGAGTVPAPPARFVPQGAAGFSPYGMEIGGGERVIAQGLRMVLLPAGAVRVAETPLAVVPSRVLALPDRVGGGFVFVSGTSLYHASDWLGAVRLVYVHPTNIANVFVGLDRLIVRGSSGAHVGLNMSTLARTDAVGLPAAPSIGAFAAADGWHALAMTDGQGLLLTSDAGTSWRRVNPPVDARTIQLLGDHFLVQGADASKREGWFEVFRTGEVARATGATTTGTAKRPKSDALVTSSVGSQPLGPRPLRRAIEDGWPLKDGTAVVAHAGALYRVDLQDGAIVDEAPRAFEGKNARCHPLALPTAADPSGFGFVCGEPEGATVIYAYDAERAAVTALLRFGSPRAVWAGGTGGLVVRGPCADVPAREEGVFCVRNKSGQQRELKLRGDALQERVVPLGDGRIALIGPPTGNLEAARITIVDGDRAKTAPLAFPKVAPDMDRALRLGIWLEGFEERRDGVIGGWIEAQGSMIGVEIGTDGRVTLGQLIRDAGDPVVSGRYGVGWTKSRRGYETVDGGMTWTTFEPPTPLTEQPESRGCGPIGCSARGWLRVGWGTPKAALSTSTQVPRQPIAPLPVHRPVALSCSLASVEPPDASAPAPAKPPPRPAPALRLGLRTPTPLPTAAASDMAPFLGIKGPATRADQRGITYEVTTSFDSSVRTGPYARVYALGPKAGDWEPSNAQWLVRWAAPFGGWDKSKSSAAATAPLHLLDVSRLSVGAYYGSYTQYALVGSTDGARALLSARRTSGAELSLFALEHDHAPVEIRRENNEPWSSVEAALHTGGAWYVAISDPAPFQQTLVYRVDGSVAHLVARMPRAVSEVRSGSIRLASHSVTGMPAVVVDGQPGPDASSPRRWLMAIDTDAGAFAEPLLLGTADAAERAPILPCTDDAPGWLFDASTPLPIAVEAAGARATLGGAFARLRFDETRACLVAATGSVDPTLGAALRDLAKKPGFKPQAPPRSESFVPVAVIAQRTRYGLVCQEKR